MSTQALFQEITIADATMQALRGPLRALQGRMEYLFEAAAHFYRCGRVIGAPLIRRLPDGLYKMRLTQGLRIPFFFEQRLGGVALHFGEIGNHAQGEEWHVLPPRWRVEEAVNVSLLPEAIEYVAPLCQQQPSWVKRVWDPAWPERARLHPELDLHLHLDDDQWAIASCPGPILLRGSAGCGKTTVAIYRLLATEGSGRRRLYLTFTPHLKRHAEELYDAIRNEQAEKPEFKTIEELCRELVGEGHDTRFPAEGKLSWSRFRERHFSRMNRLVGHDPDQIWEEIQAVIKGDERLLHRPDEAHLRYEEYLASPLRGADNPAATWEVFEQYRRLEGWDDMDLARAAYRTLRYQHGALAAFDEVIVDEAQDLTVFHLGLVLALCRNPDGLFLAGDTQQAIHPSRFNWTRWRETMYREWGVRLGAGDVQTLARNYRSPRPVVELANAVALWRQQTWAEDEALTVAAVRDGEPVRHLSLAQLPPVPARQQLTTRLMVICRDEACKRELQATFTTAHVFTVHEAKGLEGEVVILWGLFGADREVWDFHRIHDPRYKGLVNRLVVAATRAHRVLFVVDDYLPTHWSGLAHADWEQGPAAIAALAQELQAPPEDRDVLLRRAGHWEEAGRFEQAAGLFERLGDWGAAGRCLYALERWEQAGEAYARAEAHRLAGTCWEKAGKWRQAGEAYQLAGCAQEAGQAYVKAGAWEAAVTQFLACGDWGAAGRCEEALQRGSQAIHCYQRAGRWNDVGRCLSQQGDWEPALEAYTRAGNEAAATACLEPLGRWTEAAERHGRAGRHHPQGRCFLAAGQAAPAERAFRRAQAWREVGWLQARRGELNQAYRHFTRAEAPFLAFLVAWQSGDWLRMSQQMEQWALGLSLGEPLPPPETPVADPWQTASEIEALWQQADPPACPALEQMERVWAPYAWEVARSCAQQAWEASESGPRERQARRLERLTDLQSLLAQGRLTHAAKRLDLAGKPAWAARYYERAQAFREAAHGWMQADEFARAARAARQADAHDLAEQCEGLAKLLAQGPEVLAEYCELERDWARAARLYERAKRWLPAGRAQLEETRKQFQKQLGALPRRPHTAEHEPEWFILKGKERFLAMLERAARCCEFATQAELAGRVRLRRQEAQTARTREDWHQVLAGLAGLCEEMVLLEAPDVPPSAKAS